MFSIPTVNFPQWIIIPKGKAQVKTKGPDESC